MAKDDILEKTEGLTIIRVPARPTLQRLLEIVAEVATTDDCRRRLWDLTKGFDLSAEEIGKLAARGREHWPIACRVAYLAGDDLAYGLLRMFEVFREQENYETRVFRDEDEARAWLKAWEG